eukprot:3739161-Pleurochrysis_carterae.AAC.1
MSSGDGADDFELKELMVLRGRGVVYDAVRTSWHGAQLKRLDETSSSLSETAQPLLNILGTTTIYRICSPKSGQSELRGSNVSQALGYSRPHSPLDLLLPF